MRSFKTCNLATQFRVQYSHVRRTPFSVPTGTPADAAVTMPCMNVRYFLP